MKLAILFLLAILVAHVNANTEKMIFTADSRLVKGQCQDMIREPIMKPPYTKRQQGLIPSTKTKENPPHLFYLEELKDGFNYEIRVSYPAIASETPADFELYLADSCFTDNNDVIYTLAVSAVYTGVSPISGMESRPIVYDLVLENLYFGVIFYQCYRIIIAITGMIILGFFFVMPKCKQLITKKMKAL